MKIKIDNELSLTEIRLNDKPSLVKHLNDESVYRNTMSIPFPYGEADADAWIDRNQKLTDTHGNHLNLAIRKSEELIGVVGLLDVGPPDPHRSELGYWLAKPERNQGVTSRALSHFIPYAFETFALRKLTAQVFSGNVASERVLLKCGFEKEGYFRSQAIKNGTPIDLVAFGLLKDEYGT